MAANPTMPAYPTARVYETQARLWPLFAALCLLYGIIGTLFLIIMRKTGGHLVYTLDDPYIHMAIAKNFSENLVWGVTRYGFNSASSSPIWTLLLAASYRLFGVNNAAPLVLNVFFATTTVCAAFSILKRIPARRPTYIFAALAGFILMTEIPSLIFSGMETILQIFLVLLFTHHSAKLISADRESPGRLCQTSLLVLAPLLTMARYEDLAVVFIVCILLMLYGRLALSALVLLSGLAPIVIYGVVSASHSGYWLPNSLILKALRPDLTSVSGIAYFFTHFYNKVLSSPEMLLLLVILLMLYIVDFTKSTTSYKKIFLVISLAACLIQAMFSAIGSAGSNLYSYRYEAYVVALGLLSVMNYIPEYLQDKAPSFTIRTLPKYLAVFMLASFPVFSLSHNCWYMTYTPLAASNIYQQQYQMGLFLRQFYQGKTVVLNDIGAANYLADIKCVDLVGLCSDEIMREKVKNMVRQDGYVMLSRLTQEQIARLARRADIAILYAGWFPGTLPPQWEKVGEWEIRENVTCDQNVVSFYVINPSEKDRLIDNLRLFSTILPKDVTQRYYGN
jgi:hypothetical protein